MAILCEVVRKILFLAHRSKVEHNETYTVPQGKGTAMVPLMHKLLLRLMMTQFYKISCTILSVFRVF